jgi:hypothetical protein
MAPLFTFLIDTCESLDSRKNHLLVSNFQTIQFKGDSKFKNKLKLLICHFQTFQLPFALLCSLFAKKIAFPLPSLFK